MHIQSVVDLRPGGAFRLVMRTPSGVDLPIDAVFREVVQDERTVVTAHIHGDVLVWTDVRFAEHDGKTTLSVHQVYSREPDATRGAEMGWTSALNQLVAHVADA